MIPQVRVLDRLARGREIQRQEHAEARHTQTGRYRYLGKGAGGRRVVTGTMRRFSPDGEHAIDVGARHWSARAQAAVGPEAAWGRAPPGRRRRRRLGRQAAMRHADQGVERMAVRAAPRLRAVTPMSDQLSPLRWLARRSQISCLSRFPAPNRVVHWPYNAHYRDSCRYPTEARTRHRRRGSPRSCPRAA